MIEHRTLPKPPGPETTLSDAEFTVIERSYQAHCLLIWHYLCKLCPPGRGPYEISDLYQYTWYKAAKHVGRLIKDGLLDEDGLIPFKWLLARAHQIYRQKTPSQIQLEEHLKIGQPQPKGGDLSEVELGQAGSNQEKPLFSQETGNNNPFFDIGLLQPLELSKTGYAFLSWSCQRSIYGQGYQGQTWVCAPGDTVAVKFCQADQEENSNTAGTVEYNSSLYPYLYACDTYGRSMRPEVPTECSSTLTSSSVSSGGFNLTTSTQIDLNTGSSVSPVIAADSLASYVGSASNQAYVFDLSSSVPFFGQLIPVNKGKVLGDVSYRVELTSKEPGTETSPTRELATTPTESAEIKHCFQVNSSDSCSDPWDVFLSQRAKLHRFFRIRGLSIEDAEEAVQEVAVRVLSNKETVPTAALLFAAARHVLNEEVRRGLFRKELAENQPDFVDFLSQIEARDFVQQLLGKVSVTDRKIALEYAGIIEQTPPQCEDEPEGQRGQLPLSQEVLQVELESFLMRLERAGDLPSDTEEQKAETAVTLNRTLLKWLADRLPTAPERKAETAGVLEQEVWASLKGTLRPIIPQLLQDVPPDYPGKQRRAALVNRLLENLHVAISVTDEQGKERFCGVVAIHSGETNPKGYLRLIEREGKKGTRSRKSYSIPPIESIQIKDSQEVKTEDHSRQASNSRE